MKILSIYTGHNSTVAISINGKVECALSEERILRLKNATGFPEMALKYVVEKFLEGDINNADYIFFPANRVKNKAKSSLGYNLTKLDFKSKPLPATYYYLKRKKDLKRLRRIKLRKLFGLKSKTKVISKDLVEKGYKNLVDYFGGDENKLDSLDHHEAHAYAALAFDINTSSKYLAFTLDGAGGGLSGTVGIIEDGKLEIISKVLPKASLGYLYSGVTAYLGMKPIEHEFKVMGMAPYAYPEHAERIAGFFEEILSLDDNFEFKSKFDFTSYDLRKYLIENLIYERFDNIAGGIQLFTERIIIKWVKGWIKKTGLKNIILGGGVFMNVKAVKCVSELDEVDDIFVIPSAGDEFLVLGACYYGNKINDVRVDPIDTLYLGREFSDSDADDFFNSDNTGERYEITKFNEDEMAKEVAKILASNEVVARCCGREEWGARALGNRSLMANPSDFETISIINHKIKNRDFWMPFTPSILDENFDDYIINPKNIYAPYMCITFDSTDRAQKELRAAIHPKDKTVRPQIVEEKNNSGYYKIIKEFKNITGIGAILNTSFNLHGEPNVGSPEDAIHTLDNSGLNYLILGSYLLKKK